jgi:hypothetical protein
MDVSTVTGLTFDDVDTAVIAFVFDGFSANQFTKVSSHFQAAWAPISVGGRRVPNHTSRDNLRPIAKCASSEETAIPIVIAEMNKQMLTWTGVNHENCIVLPDGTVRIMLKKPFEALDKNGNITMITKIRPVVSADVKAILMALCRKGAGSNHYCYFSLDHCNRSVNEKACTHLTANTTMGDLRSRFRDLRDFPEYKAWKAQMDAAGVRGKHSPVGNITKKDYDEALLALQAAQVGLPMFDWIPDDALLIYIFPPEALHANIQCMRHKMDMAHKLRAECPEQLTPVLVGPLDCNDILPSKYFRGITGVTGNQLWSTRDDNR